MVLLNKTTSTQKWVAKFDRQAGENGKSFNWRLRSVLPADTILSTMMLCVGSSHSLYGR